MQSPTPYNAIQMLKQRATGDQVMNKAQMDLQQRVHQRNKANPMQAISLFINNIKQDVKKETLPEKVKVIRNHAVLNYLTKHDYIKLVQHFESLKR